MLIDNVALETTHSIFINEIKGNILIFAFCFKEKGYTLDIKMINSVDTKLREYGEYLYDHIIVFCTAETSNLIFFQFP